jgi:hypothetical protein
LGTQEKTNQEGKQENKDHVEFQGDFGSVPKVCARIWGGSADNRSGGCLSAFSFTKIQVLPDGKRVVRAETQIL